MDKSASLSYLAITALVAGCGSETARQTAYEALQNVREQECLENPNSPSDCGKRDGYDDYQRKRKELEPSD